MFSFFSNLSKEKALVEPSEEAIESSEAAVESSEAAVESSEAAVESSDEVGKKSSGAGFLNLFGLFWSSEASEKDDDIELQAQVHEYASTLGATCLEETINKLTSIHTANQVICSAIEAALHAADEALNAADEASNTAAKEAMEAASNAAAGASNAAAHWADDAKAASLQVAEEKAQVKARAEATGDYCDADIAIMADYLDTQERECHVTWLLHLSDVIEVAKHRIMCALIDQGIELHSREHAEAAIEQALFFFNGGSEGKSKT